MTTRPDRSSETSNQHEGDQATRPDRRAPAGRTHIHIADERLNTGTSSLPSLLLLLGVAMAHDGEAWITREGLIMFDASD
jgi:hypothetical protein